MPIRWTETTVQTLCERALPESTRCAVVSATCIDTLRQRAHAVGIEPYREDLHPKRLREFLAGRLAARSALQCAGAPMPTIGRDGTRPVWPAGFAASISHGGDFAVAVATADEAAIGIDLEPLIAAHRLPALRNVFDEPDWQSFAGKTDLRRATRGWTAKEAAWKCFSARSLTPTMRAIELGDLDAGTTTAAWYDGHRTHRLHLRCADDATGAFAVAWPMRERAPA